MPRGGVGGADVLKPGRVLLQAREEGVSPPIAYLSQQMSASWTNALTRGGPADLFQAPRAAQGCRTFNEVNGVLS